MCQVKCAGSIPQGTGVLTKLFKSDHAAVRRASLLISTSRNKWVSKKGEGFHLKQKGGEDT
jgi:hypothetical protein